MRFPTTYDVFVSFRGEDTRRGFTDKLHEALQRKGIRTSTEDAGLQRGEEISQSRTDSVEGSRSFLVFFSENYASSTWCLDELVKIMECVKGKHRPLIPVFYDVDPSDVRYKHKEKFQSCPPNNVLQWAKALQEAADISGLNFNPRYESESELIGKIAEAIFSKACGFPFPVANYPVGLEDRSLELMQLLDVGSADEEVKTIGIWGMSGIGKTTIARAVYNAIADRFGASTFLHHKRRGGHLVMVQATPPFDVVVGDRTIALDNVNLGNLAPLKRLSGKRVLLVLDNVHHLQPLQALARVCGWFRGGSRIIITTRDKHLLDSHGVGTQFEVKPLNDKDALELISWNAFRTNAVDPSYVDASHRTLLHAKGLPLALEVLGSIFNGNKTHALAQLARIPPSAAFHEILRVIYDDLDHVQKTIFLDIACFFQGQRLDYVSNLLQSTCGFSFDSAIRGLVEKSLVRVECGVLRMHDLLRDLGREIVRQQSRSRPFKLVKPTCEGASRDLKYSTMGTLNFLHLMQHPSSFPSNIYPRRVVALDVFKSLGHMVLKSCKLPRVLPDLSGVPNLLELGLQDCKNLTEIHHSIGLLDIRSLCARGCSNLDTCLHAMKLKSLDLFDCTSFQVYLQILQKMENIREADLVGTISQEFPKSCIDSQSFRMHKGRQGSPILSSSVTHLDLSRCNLSDEVFVYLVFFPNLQSLNLAANNFTILPACIKECSHLSYLSLDGCKNLRGVEGVPPNIELFRAANCTSLTPISSTMLLSQALHEAGNTQFILPGSTIPEWFDHLNWGGSVAFWVHNKFPHIALCLVLRGSYMQLTKFKLKLRMLINGKYQFDFDYNYFLTLAADHIMMFDLRSQMGNYELEEILLDNEWNHVQVSCVNAPSLEGNVVEMEIVKCMGVYVYKQQSSVTDIRFANPNSRKREDNLFWGNGDLEPHCYTLLKRQREFLGTGAFHALNMTQQNNLGSVAQNTQKRIKTVFEDRGKYSAVYSDVGMESDIEWLSLLPSLQPLTGSDMILNPVVSKTTSDVSDEKGANRVEPNDNLFPIEHCTDYVGSSSNDIAAKETYASIGSHANDLSLLIDTRANNGSGNTKLSDEAMTALENLRDCVTKGFPFLLDPGRSRFLKTILDNLLSFSEDDGISVRMRSVILQLSRSFNMWGSDYDAASVTLDNTTADLIKVDKLQADIEANVMEVEEVDSVNDELCKKLASLQERKRQLEEHIEAVKEEITEFEISKGHFF